MVKTKSFSEAYRARQKKIHQLASICFERRELTKDELKELDEHRKEVVNYIYDRWWFVVSKVEMELLKEGRPPAA